MSEYLYIAENRSMPGLLKVGCTTRSPMDRLDELHSTGVPTPFHFVLVLKVANAASAERTAHSVLVRYRVHRNREFFQTTPRVAIPKVLQAVENYEIEWDYTPRDKEIIELEKRVAEKIEKKRQEIALEVTKLNREGDRLKLEIDALERKRRSLGNEPPTREVKFSDDIPFFIWCPFPLGWIPWSFVKFWIFDDKHPYVGASCLLAIVISFIVHRQIVAETETYYKSKKPFYLVRDEIEKVNAALGEIQGKVMKLTQSAK